MKSKPKHLTRAHVNTIEHMLMCSSKIAVSSGHPVNKGAIREFFVKEFLLGHIGADLGVTSGEIFDAERKVGSRTNQIDVIVYDKGYPKLQLTADGMDSIMVDAVHATIEVKSELKKDNLLSSLRVMSRLRKLKVLRAGPHFCCYIVAYQCKANPRDVYNWIKEADEIPNNFAICLLEKGFIASPWLTAQMHSAGPARQRCLNEGKWLVRRSPDGILYLLFFLLNIMRLGADMWTYFPDRLANVEYLDPPPQT